MANYTANFEVVITFSKSFKAKDSDTAEEKANNWLGKKHNSIDAEMYKIFEQALDIPLDAVDIDISSVDEDC